jgi:hypothetical protein
MCVEKARGLPALARVQRPAFALLGFGGQPCSLHNAMMSTDTRGERWDWTWNIYKGPPGFGNQGQADTKAEAQAEIEKQWRAWVEAAGSAS